MIFDHLTTAVHLSIYPFLIILLEFELGSRKYMREHLIVFSEFHDGFGSLNVSFTPSVAVVAPVAVEVDPVVVNSSCDCVDACC